MVEINEFLDENKMMQDKLESAVHKEVSSKPQEQRKRKNVDLFWSGCQAQKVDSDLKIEESYQDDIELEGQIDMRAEQI